MVDRVGTGIKPVFGIRNIHAENTMNLLLPLRCLLPVCQQLPSDLSSSLVLAGNLCAQPSERHRVLSFQQVIMLLDTQLAGCSHPGAALAQSL